MISVSVSLAGHVTDADIEATRDYVAEVTRADDIKIAKISNLDPVNERFTTVIGGTGPGRST